MTVGGIEIISAGDLTGGVMQLLNVTLDDLDILLKHYKVTHKALEDMVSSIRDWFLKQPHLPQGYLPDEVIIRHLITRGFSVERVKEKIDNYFSVRAKIPDILCSRDPMDPTIQTHLLEGFWTILPKKTPSGNRISILRCVNEDFTVVDLLKIAYMMGDYRLRNDFSLGDEYIMDLKNVNLYHTMQMTPMMISNFLFYTTECFGPKIKGIHLVNVPSYGVAMVNLIKRMMKTKLAQRMHVYENIEDILKCYPKEIIPKDLGGDEISCQEIANNWARVFQAKPWRQYFIDMDKVVTDESKRENPKESDDIYGIKGSFRKLDLD